MVAPSILIWLFALLGVGFIALFIFQVIKKRPLARTIPILTIGIAMLVLAFGVIA